VPLRPGGGTVTHSPTPSPPRHAASDPEEIWSTVEDCLVRALAAARVTPAHCVSVGITNQRETVVVWNRETGRPYHNALVWQDQRGQAACARLAAASPQVRLPCGGGGGGGGG
jgi:glycerol kinase